MEIARVRALRGPNLWSRHTSLEAVVVCTPQETRIGQLPGFETRLRARFPDIGAMQPIGHEGDISLAHVLAFAGLALQAEAGCPVSFCHTQPTHIPGTYRAVFEYTEEPVGRLALNIAEDLIASALADTPFELAAALSRLKILDEDIRLGPSTGAIVAAAIARGIPYHRLTEGSMVQFGWGVKQRRIQAAETDRSSAIAEDIAKDKELTKMLLEAAGVPVPRGRPVTDVEQGWRLALSIGLPVVVKPRDGNQGKGVTVNIGDRAQFERAFTAAKEYCDHVMVERFIPGHDYRLLVVGGQLVAAARREPPHVIGDGVHTVRELVDQVNADPRRGEGHATSLTKIRFDEIALAQLAYQGLDADSIPEKGRRVVLRNNANLSTGGTATDVTDEVHPEVAARAVEAALMVGLDIAGVDVVCETVMKPLEEQGGGIVEVNAAPGLRMHLSPSYGKGRPVGEAIVDVLFPPSENGRIPVVAVTGTNGKTTTTRLIAHLLRERGLCVGMTLTDGVFVGSRCIDTGDCSGPKSARSVLMHPDVEAAVLETARGGILREGLGFDRCTVGVVTNIGRGDHLGMNFCETPEDIAPVKRVIVQNVSPVGHAVLNACDPLVAAMATLCPGGVIFFAHDPHHPVAVAQRAQGKRLVYLDGGHIVLSEGAWERRIALADIPLTRNGTVAFQIENAMAGLGAVWALGLAALDADWETVCRGLASFDSDAHTVPGRFNVFHWRGATLVADYGHNLDAMAALVRALSNMPGKRRIAVATAAGDRRDEDIRAMGQILAETFDLLILFEDACRRGRSEGQTLALLRQGAQSAARVPAIEEIQGEFLAIDRALAQLRAGDVCLILVDQVDDALAHIRHRIEEPLAERPASI